MKILVVIMIAVILFSLGSALTTLIKYRGESEKTVKFLTIRVALSIILFLLLMVGFATGVFQPHTVA
ncbi:twin transmembrane helix small protein [Burkholderiaceae bacterium DAT-1]|nr:twin transmembrane helix small protein [Burkholderiaceae bacterium DAT-1]